MLDLLFILAGLVFFAISILYIYGCEWFIKDQNQPAGPDRVETTGERKPAQGRTV